MFPEANFKIWLCTSSALTGTATVLLQGMVSLFLKLSHYRPVMGSRLDLPKAV